MTIQEVIDKVDFMRPNCIPQLYKINAINKLETMVQTELYHVPFNMLVIYSVSDTEKKLIIDKPYDTLYEKYLAAEIDLVLSEFSAYQNDYLLFNGEYSEFAAYVMRTKGKKGGHIKNYW